MRDTPIVSLIFLVAGNHSTYLHAMNALTESYCNNGFAIVEDFLTCDELKQLTTELESKGCFDYTTDTIGESNLVSFIAPVQQLAASPKLMAIVRSLIGEEALPFYSIILDKSAAHNWGLDWHQDLKIAVKTKIETEGYDGWSVEAGITHVIPPIGVLQKLVTVRLHIDDCDHTNGAVWAMPGTHTMGVIDTTQVNSILQKHKIHPCHAKAGSIMLMSPLLLHKSPYAISAGSRRVLQIEYRATELTNGLEWFNEQ